MFLEASEERRLPAERLARLGVVLGEGASETHEFGERLVLEFDSGERSRVKLADILNAASLAFQDNTFWSGDLQIGPNKDEVLKELVLKNIELFEYQETLK